MTEADAYPVWLWRNAPDVRAVSWTTAPIPFQEHVRWFTAAIADPQRRLLCLLADGTTDRMGMLRLDIAPPLAFASILLAEAWRGQRYAAPALLFLDSEAAAIPSVWTLLALIKPANVPSFRAFLRAGYTLAHEQTELLLLSKAVARPRAET